MQVAKRRRTIGLILASVALVVAVAGAFSVTANETVSVSQEADRPASESAAAAPVQQLDAEQLRTVESLVFNAVELPAGAEIVRVEPGFDADGNLVGGVAVIVFEPFTGTLEWPSDQLYRSATGETLLSDLIEYEVVGLHQALIAVDLDAGRVQWASPDPGGRADDRVESGEEVTAADRDEARVIAVRVSDTTDITGQRSVDLGKEGLVRVEGEQE